MAQYFSIDTSINKYFLTCFPNSVPQLVHVKWIWEYLPINAVTFGLMIPLGKRWKSYSTESTTTVCPALLPPCRLDKIYYFSPPLKLGMKNYFILKPP